MIENVRYWSRNLIREFGFLNKHYPNTEATHSECHTLIELKRIGSLQVGELTKILKVDKSVASRILSQMHKKSWIKIRKDEDKRKKTFILSSQGKKILKQVEKHANGIVLDAFNELQEEEREVVHQGLALYAKALKLSRLRSEYTIRTICINDDASIAKIVRKSIKDLGFDGPGTAAADTTLDCLSQNFVGKNKIYLVAVKEGPEKEELILGGAGIAPLPGGTKKTCELVRMFIDSKSRGKGLGQLLMNEALKKAKEFGYNYCYLETTEVMKAAQSLYLNNGFQYLDSRMGETGHFACKVYMGKRL